MTPAPSPVRSRALKLLQLARRGVGGERDNALRLLLAHLRTHDLTLFDIDPGLPITQDVTALANLRESQLLMAHLGSASQDEALDQLVDATDLTSAELTRVLDVMDPVVLARVRAPGWAHLDGVSDEAYLNVAGRLTPATLQAYTGSIAQRAHAAVRSLHWQTQYPLRTLRVQGDLEQALVAGMLSGLGAVRVQITSEGVQAHLDAQQLAGARTMMANQLPALRREALDAARQLGERAGRSWPR